MEERFKQFIMKLFLTVKTIKNLCLFVFDFFGLVRREVTYLFRNNPARMLARGGTNDKSELVVVFSGSEYDLPSLPKFDKPLIIDLGGHIGSFSIFAWFFYISVNPRIIVLEPSRNNFLQLTKNLKINRLDSSITAIHAAIGTREGAATLDTSKDGDGYFLADSGIVRNLRDVSHEECRITTMNALTTENGIELIDILKIDIEGSEYELFADSKSFELIRNKVRVVLMEIHDLDQAHNRTIIKELAGADFEIRERGNILYLFNRKLQ